MRDLYSDDYESVVSDEAARLVPNSVQKLAGAAVFVGLVAIMGVWSYRLGTRDAAEVPIIRALEGPARVQPDDPGGLQAAHQGLEVNSVLAGQRAPAPRDAPLATAAPPALAPEDGPQGALVLASPPNSPDADGKLTELRMPVEEDVPDERAGPPVPVVPPLNGEAPGAAMLANEPDGDAAADAAADKSRPRGRPQNLAAARETPAAPAAASERADPPATPAQAEARAAAGLTPGTRMVQLGAYDSENVTRQAWTRIVSRNSELLGSKKLYIERTTSNSRVFYRLRVAGFESAQETARLCEALRGRGVDCMPVTLQ